MENRIKLDQELETVSGGEQSGVTGSGTRPGSGFPLPNQNPNFNPGQFKTLGCPQCGEKELLEFIMNPGEPVRGKCKVCQTEFRV